MTGYSDMTYWHRRLSPVTDGIIISGDLAEDPDQAVRQLGRWQKAGITHVLDTRSEWSDEELVAEHAPDIIYGWICTDDEVALPTRTQLESSRSTRGKLGADSAAIGDSTPVG